MSKILRDTFALVKLKELRDTGESGISNFSFRSRDSQEGDTGSSSSSSIRELSVIEERKIKRSSKTMEEELQREQDDPTSSRTVLASTTGKPVSGEEAPVHDTWANLSIAVRPTGRDSPVKEVESRFDRESAEITKPNLFTWTPPRENETKGDAAPQVTFGETTFLSSVKSGRDSPEAVLTGPTRQSATGPTFSTTPFNTAGGDARSLDTHKIQGNALAKSMRFQIQKKSHHIEDTTVPPQTGSYQVDRPAIFPQDEEDWSRNPTPAAEKKRQVPFCCRCLLVLVLLLALIAAIVVFVITRAEPVHSVFDPVVAVEQDPEPLGRFSCEKEVTVMLQDSISIACQFNDDVNDDDSADTADDDVALIRVTPPYFLGQEEGLVYLNSTRGNITYGWYADYDPTARSLMLNLSTASCNSHGRFLFTAIREDGTELATANTIVNVTSNVSDIDISVREEDAQFSIGCSATSGCDQSMLEFLNNKNQKLKGFEFICIVSYSDAVGYAVTCNGTIPGFMLKGGDSSIGCKHTTADKQTETNATITLKACDIENSCGEKCEDDGDYYKVSQDRCDIFHRCYNNVAYTTYCGPKTFFDPEVCTCSHAKDVGWCRDDGAKLRTDSSSCS